MSDMPAGEKSRITVLEPVWGQREAEEIIKRRHAWFGGLLPAGEPEISAVRDSFVPYLMSDVVYFRSPSSRRRCYVFENLEEGLKCGVREVENLAFVRLERPETLREVRVDEARYAAEIEHYCNLELLVKEYRKFISWTVEIQEIRLIYRKRRTVNYRLGKKSREINIFMDGISLK